MRTVIRVTSSCDGDHQAKLLLDKGKGRPRWSPCTDRLRPATAGVAIAAAYGRQVTEIYGVLEGHAFRIQRSGDSFLLAQDRVAGIAFLGNDLALGAHVLAIMTTETTGEVEVADVVVMGFPVQLHLGKSRAAIDALQF